MHSQQDDLRQEVIKLKDTVTVMRQDLIDVLAAVIDLKNFSVQNSANMASAILALQQQVSKGTGVSSDEQVAAAAEPVTSAASLLSQAPEASALQQGETSSTPPIQRKRNAEGPVANILPSASKAPKSGPAP